MERGESSSKHEVVKRGDKEKRAASAAPVAGRRPEEATVSPPLKTRKFEKYVDDPKRDGVLDGGYQQGAVDSQESGRTLKIEYSEGEMAEGPSADRTENQLGTVEPSSRRTRGAAERR